MPVLAGQSIRAIILDQSTYTPVLAASTTNPTLGSGSTQDGDWKRIDNLIIGWARIQFGTSGTNAGSGTYNVVLPFPADTTIHTAAAGVGGGTVIGGGFIRDNSAVTTGSRQIGCQLNGDAISAVLLVQDGTTGGVTEAAPFAWAASDAVTINFQYQADPTSL